MTKRMTTDRVRVVLPIALYGAGLDDAHGAAVRKSYVNAIVKELVKYAGPNHGYTVRQRADQGITIRAEFTRPLNGGAGAVSSVAGVMSTLDVVLERVGDRYGAAARASIDSLRGITIKTNGAG